MKHRIPEASSEQRKAWIEQIHVIYGALIAVSLLILQPFLFKGQASGLSAEICVIAFSIAIPILAALSLLNYEEEYRKRIVYSPIVAFVRVIGQSAAFVGLVAGFLHISIWAGLGVLVSGIIGLIAYTIGYKDLYKQK